MSSNLHFDASDLEKGSTGPNSAPPPASTRSQEGEEGTRPVVIDLAQIRLVVNIGIVLFSAVAILIFAGTGYSIFSAGGSFWEAFGCTAVAFVLCAAAVGTALFLRKDIVSILAEVARPDDASSEQSGTRIVRASQS